MSEEVKAVPPLATCMSPPPPPPPPPPPNSNDIPSPSLPINVPVPNQKMKMLSWIRIASIKGTTENQVTHFFSTTSLSVHVISFIS